MGNHSESATCGFCHQFDGRGLETCKTCEDNMCQDCSTRIYGTSDQFKDRLGYEVDDGSDDEAEDDDSVSTYGVLLCPDCVTTFNCECVVCMESTPETNDDKCVGCYGFACRGCSILLKTPTQRKCWTCANKDKPFVAFLLKNGGFETKVQAMLAHYHPKPQPKASSSSSSSSSRTGGPTTRKRKAEAVEATEKEPTLAELVNKKATAQIQMQKYIDTCETENMKKDPPSALESGHFLADLLESMNDSTGYSPVFWFKHTFSKVKYSLADGTSKQELMDFARKHGFTLSPLLNGKEHLGVRFHFTDVESSVSSEE